MSNSFEIIMIEYNPIDVERDLKHRLYIIQIILIETYAYRGFYLTLRIIFVKSFLNSNCTLDMEKIEKKKKCLTLHNLMFS